MSKYQLKWGILATGGIAESFSRDLWVNPETRGVTDIEHVVVAAASSSSADRAKAFLKEVRAPESAKAYGSYKELVADPNVDIIYVATPHSHHYQNARLCLEAGKNVLCEKAFTTNAKQLETLIKLAKEKNLFLMEAVWVRYFPLSIYVRDIITSGKIGTVYRAQADLSIGLPPEQVFADGKHRMVNMDLAGGALLDLGIYTLTWLFQTLYDTQKNPKAPSVLSTMNKYKTGVDEQTTILLSFPRDGLPNAHGVATTGFRTALQVRDTPAVRAQGTEGEIQVFSPAFRPTKTKLVLNDGTVEEKEWEHPGPGKGSGWQNGFGPKSHWNAEGVGHGMFWEADECAYAIRDGRKEGKYESLEESLVIMRVMDEVRKQNDMVYPEKIETTEYPVAL
ncbi:uncharacterized protein MYCFIDRAFT_184262 [Pseudocercospora fijiensis CIRAD86]|uniref:D-xylose 1-dehydrogenase (NADP(+), D-xylono-1,5-lactone-forming) n=1 Tax=Pseudocercospora fijiensis (strain CIRAD86) TaxID=383855 RepID=M2YGH4_PSEFD|nr:uncharacterized protein MYCFIDRAFT_184262 [Pseudocercospora fijiensis CIRAD86]EME76900.1 hypothetical protein MYCFIDRAFT_184262 [Pseudocercospora fijiensis CIRAD86]